MRFRKHVVVPFVFLLLLRAAGVGFAQPFVYTYMFDELPDLRAGDASFADVDRDGYLDLLLSGYPLQFSATPDAFSYLAIRADRQENPAVIEHETIALPVSGWSTGEDWSDYNGDGWLDVVVTGITERMPPYTSRAVLYRGSASGLTKVRSFTGLHSGTAAWADFDNDGDDDLLLMGVASRGDHRTLLYRNDDGEFSEVSTNLPGLGYGDAAWGDYDNDGDADLILIGSLSDGRFFAGLYRNNAGEFTSVSKGEFTSTMANVGHHRFAAAAWGDYDADGDLDLVIQGGRLGLYFQIGRTFLFENESGSLQLASSLTGAYDGALAWGDYDVDGDLDLLISGDTKYGKAAITEIHASEGGELIRRALLPGAHLSSVAWGDDDADGDLDLLLTGQGVDGMVFTGYFKNTSEIVNTPPTRPGNLTAVVDGSSVSFQWAAASDTLTPDALLTYALRVGTSPGGAGVMAPLAEPVTGRRLVAQAGNTGHGLSHKLTSLSPGAYYWSVQAVDAAYQGSAFAAEQSFTIQESGKSTDVNEQASIHRLQLSEPWPNPSRGPVTVDFSLPAPARVQLELFNILGQRVAILRDEMLPSGKFQSRWNGHTINDSPVAPGVYFIRLLTSHGGSRTQSLLLID